MLDLSPKFSQDVESKQTNISPLVVIDEDIYISTVKGLFDNNLFFEDYDLNISNITDSINVDSRNIQINKLTLTLSNFPKNGQRFSDFVFERGLLNKGVKVYYKTQSCTNLDDCMLIFNGTIRKLTHDSKTIRIELEDLTEDKLKKEVPISRTGHKNPYNKDYVNVPFPIVYGEVDKSPAIPVLQTNNSDNNSTNITIVPDAVDIIDSDRDISVAGFTENPLYIYKDDYYQVTENFNSNVLSFPEDFDVKDSEQYITSGSHIEIRKLFNGIAPQNAPAFNEFQCIKERKPNQCLIANNLNESQLDDNNYPFINQQVSINNPEFSIDNEYETYSKIPDTEEDVLNTDKIYEGFRTFSYDASNNRKGYFMPSSGCNWSGVVFQWLNSFMHSNNFNGSDDPHVVYKHIPTAKSMKREAEWALRDEFNLYNNGTAMQVFKDSGNDNQPFHEQYPDEYKAKINISSSNNLISNVNNGNWFIDNTPEGSSIASPQPIFLKYKIKNSLIEQLGFEEVWITMDNGTMQEPLDGTSVRIYNIFEVENSYPHLFNSEDFAEFAPTDVTTSFQDQRMHFRSYKGKLIHEDNSYPYTSSGNGFSDTTWFGAYGYNQAGWNATRTRKKDILADSNSSWVIWAKKRVDGVGSHGDDSLLNYGYDHDTPFDSEEYSNFKERIHINANTMYPCEHRGHYKSSYGSGSGYVLSGISYGILQNENSETFTIHDNYSPNSTPDSRVSLIFPFNDLDISDEISNETFFKGTVKCFFDSENTDDQNNMKFIVQVSPADQVEGSEGELIYETFDSEDWSSKLIEKTLESCLDNDPFWSTNSQDLINDDNATDLNSNNSFVSIDGDYNGKLKEFEESSTFSNINLTYRLQTFNPSTGEDNVGGSIYNASLFTHIHDVSLLHYIIFEKALDSPFYLNVSGRINENNQLIENPSEIINHFIENELMFDEVLDQESLEEFNLIHSGEKYAFTIKEVKKGKEIIEGLSKNTRLFPRFKSGSNFSFSHIKDTYSNEDVAQVINTSDIIKYSFSRTPIQNIKTIVNVKYKMDYAEDDFLEETGYVDGYDMFGKGDGEEGRPDGYKYSYLGLDREDKVLEFESEYIRDKSTAEALRNFLYMFNCNQHNVFKINLPVSRYISLEAGDVVQFDSLIENVRAYGEDYTQEVVRNAQTIYPFFIITKITKKLKSIDIECMQLHDLTPFKFQCATGSLTRLQSVSDTGYRTNDDFFILENYLFGGEKYFTSTQKQVADINNDGLINEKDLDMLQETLLPSFGDVNADGYVNIADVVALVNQIISQEQTTEEQLSYLDLNQDGVVNVADIIAVVNQILGGSDG